MTLSKSGEQGIGCEYGQNEEEEEVGAYKNQPVAERRYQEKLPGGDQYSNGNDGDGKRFPEPTEQHKKDRKEESADLDESEQQGILAGKKLMKMNGISPFKFITGNKELIQVKVQVNQRYGCKDFPHVVEMKVGEIIRKFIILSEEEHGQDDSRGTGNKGAGNEIGAEDGTVPACPGSHGEKP